MATTPTSPKVTAGASTAAIIGLVLSYVTALTPDSFAFLGKYQGLAFLVVTLAAGAFAAWWKTDPLRTVPTDAATTAEPAALPALAAPTTFTPTQAKLDAAIDPAAPRPPAAPAEPAVITPVYNP